MAIIGGYVTKKITSEVNLFGSIMQQNVIENEFNREYAPLATIQQCMAIEFTIMGANDLYLDLKNSRLLALAKITKEDWTNIDATTATPINMTLHSKFCEIGLKLNGRNVSDTSQLYQLTPRDSSQLLQKDFTDPTSLRGMDTGHYRAHECYCSRWEQS